MSVAGARRIPVVTVQILNDEVVKITTSCEEPPSLHVYTNLENTRAGTLIQAIEQLIEGKKVRIDLRNQQLLTLRQMLKEREAQNAD